MKAILTLSITVCLGFQTLFLSAQHPGEFNAVSRGAVVGLDALDLKTGDLMFFQNTVIEGVIINLGTLSHLTHVAMVVKDPVDGSLWLTHATDNSYDDGVRIAARNESEPRDGVIMTRLQSCFQSKNEGESGFYKKIWVFKLNESLIKRPSSEEVLAFYEKNKHHRFETSELRFLFSAYDLNIFGKDWISFRKNENRICSEYVHQLLTELEFPVEQNQEHNEYTPGDICYIISPLYHQPALFTYREGAYSMTDY